MTFGNPIIGGNDTLVRQAMQSEGFVSGSDGWRIARAGDAEFNNVVVRGELDVTGSDGSQVRAVASGGHADVLWTPQTTPGRPWTPAKATCDVDIYGSGTQNPSLAISSPAQTGSLSSPSQIYLDGPGQTDQNSIALRSQSVSVRPSETGGTTSFFVQGLSNSLGGIVQGDLEVQGQLSLAAWTAFTPTWSGSTTNPSLGNGTVDAAYRKCGSVVLFRITYTFGTTTNFGAGAWGFTLPAAIPPKVVQSASALMVDASASSRFPGSAFLTNASGVFRVLVPTGGVGASPSVPFTWADGDILSISGSYET